MQNKTKMFLSVASDDYLVHFLYDFYIEKSISLKVNKSAIFTTVNKYLNLQ